MRFSIEDLGSVPGLSQVAEGLEGQPADPEAPGNDLPILMTILDAAADIGINPGMVNMALLSVAMYARPAWPKRRGRDLGRAIGRLMFAAEREQLERDNFQVPWLEVHAPHEGAVRATHITDRNRNLGFDLDVFGSTIFRKGRRTRVTVTDDTQDTPECIRHFATVAGTPTRHIWGDQEGPWELEDVEVLGNTEDPVTNCKACSIAPDEIDLSTHVTEPFLDRLNIPRSKRQTFHSLWERHLAFGVPVPLPLPHGPAALLNIGFRSQTSITWTLKYKLAGRHLYQRYWRSDHQNAPAMWAFQS